MKNRKMDAILFKNLKLFSYSNDTFSWKKNKNKLFIRKRQEDKQRGLLKDVDLGTDNVNYRNSLAAIKIQFYLVIKNKP